MSGLRLAASWSLKMHYSVTLHKVSPGAGERGTSLCALSCPVYSDSWLRHRGFSPARLGRPRPLCKHCQQLKEA